MPYPYIKELERQPIADREGARKIQEVFMPMTVQEVPFNAKQLHADFCADREKCEAEYFLKRQTVKGVVMWMGDDIHNKPSIQLSDKPDGDCYVHCVLAKKDYADVKVGDEIVMQGNFLECHPEFGVVLKMSEVVKNNVEIK